MATEDKLKKAEIYPRKANYILNFIETFEQKKNYFDRLQVIFEPNFLNNLGTHDKQKSSLFLTQTRKKENFIVDGT
jgi:hypothetical protein